MKFANPMKNSLKNMKMKTSTYFIMLFVSIFAFGLVLPVILITFLGSVFTGATQFAVVAIPLFLVFVVAMYPLLVTSNEKRQIDNDLPLFVTRMAALSTSELPVERIFEVLSEMKEYGRLAEDSGRINRLITDYHMSASEACRFVAVRSPSSVESDFLQRLSHSLDVGERTERFLANEQDATMDEYTLKCHAVLQDVDTIKGIFVAIVTSLVFLAVFVSIIPILTSQSVEMLIISVLATFAGMEFLFLYIFYAKVPKDQLWYSWNDKYRNGHLTPKDKVLIFSVLIAVIITISFGFVLMPVQMPGALKLSILCLPAMIPGVMVLNEEKKIVKRDNMYGAFIRALGRSAEVSGQSMVESVNKLSLHKFGSLTEMIKNLSKRLFTRIDAPAAWGLFSAESSSNLIHKFNEMYVHSTANGAKPGPTSIFISNNLMKVLSVRKKRFLIASSFMGVIYGIMFSIAFTLWITIGIVDYISETMNSLVIENTDLLPGGFIDNLFASNIDTGLLSTMVLAMVVIHGVSSSIMLAILRGGNAVGSAIHFVGLVIVGAMSSFLVDLFMQVLL